MNKRKVITAGISSIVAVIGVSGAVYAGSGVASRDTPTTTQAGVLPAQTAPSTAATTVARSIASTINRAAPASVVSPPTSVEGHDANDDWGGATGVSDDGASHDVGDDQGGHNTGHGSDDVASTSAVTSPRSATSVSTNSPSVTSDDHGRRGRGGDANSGHG